MGGSLCRACCRKEAESGDALDLLSPEERQRRRERLSWAENQVEDFLRAPASCRDRARVGLMMRMTSAGFPRTDPAARAIPFTIESSPIVKGLRLLQPAEGAGAAAEGGTVCEALKALSGSKKVIVGSIRMGYGHHRIAYSALTWALQLGHEPHLLDILAPDCVESQILRNMDKQYSRMSRLASNFGGFVDRLWGDMMLKGDINMLRFFLVLAERIRPIMAAMPRDVPVISTHPIIGDIAVACGFKKVINLVFDNHPQYFVLVPGALNLLQSPSYFDKLLDMGCPAANLRLAGHWVSSDICLNTVADSEARMARCEKTELPRRFLIAVGGAGAQKAFLEELLQSMQKLLSERKVRIYVNCGDHVHIADAVVRQLKKLGLEWDEVTSSEGTAELCRRNALKALKEPEGWKAVTVLRFDSHFAAFQCTDLVIRIADVLVTKPSELAFFPVPKLHIRRVGAHEAFSAVRSEELGDGTVECRTVPHTMQKLRQLIEDRSPLFQMMNRSIISAAQAKIYEGSRVACECAFSA